MRKLFVSAVALAVLMFAAPASAIVTSSNVTSPVNPTFLDPDVGGPSSPDLTVSGNAIAGGGDEVDIVCVNNLGTNLQSFPIEEDVPVSAGSFSVVVDQWDFYNYLCRVIAVPANDDGPYDMSNFSGPIVSNGGFELSIQSGGPNDGALYNYEQFSAALEGYWTAHSAGRCFVYNSYAVEPSTLLYGTPFWDCSSIPQAGGAPAPEDLKIGGAGALLPGAQDDSLLGFRGITDFTHSVEPGTGNMRVTDTETPVICVDAGCSSYADSGLKLFQKQTGGTLGHTLAIEHRWVNETGSAKQLDFHYWVETTDLTPGWRLPGESAYSEHPDPAVITPAGAGPGSLFTAFAAGTGCSGTFDPCGSLTWSRAPASALVDENRVDLAYSISVPANDSETIGLTYSQGYPQSAVDGYAAAAEQAYTVAAPETAFTVGKLKRNKKKGTVTLPVEVPGAGALHAEGKKVKTVDLQATEAGTVQMPVAAKGKAKKKLKKKGKLKVSVAITFTPEESTESSTQTAKPTLKKKLKKKGGDKKK